MANVKVGTKIFRGLAVGHFIINYIVNESRYVRLVSNKTNPLELTGSTLYAITTAPTPYATIYTRSDYAEATNAMVTQLQLFFVTSDYRGY